MSIGSYPPSLLKAAAVHTMLEQLGYSKEKEIFLVLTEENVCVKLKAEGLEGDIRIGSPELPAKELADKWREFIREWNLGGSMTKQDKDQLFEENLSKGEQIVAIASLIQKGFGRWVKGKRCYVP